MKKKGDSDKIVNKADVILISVIIFIGIMAILFLNVFRKPGYNVQVRVDGNIVKELPLEKDSNYICETPKGVNTIVIKDGEVHVQGADCPDRICEEYKPISDVGEVIICLPHKLVVEVVE